jgi:ParB family chromosome partitioning protein
MSARDRLSKLTADLVINGPSSSARTPVEAVDPKAVETRFPPSADVPQESRGAGSPATAGMPAGGVETRFPPAQALDARRPSAAPTESSSQALETRFPAVQPRPPGRRTGPGDMLAFRGRLLEVESETSELKEKLRLYEGSLPTRKLDPAKVHPSRWANRHAASFQTADFTRFKADIEQASGNVQPILVRPRESGDYEIVFGHRRHRACLELGIPVLAAIAVEPLSDVDLFAAMDRENRERADLSAWEQGTMYARALEEQMFSSQRRLAEALGVSHTWVRKAIAVAELPDTLLQCFRSPIEVDFRHAEQINAALQTDRKGVLRRAEKLRQGERMSASSVVAALTGRTRGAGTSSRDVKVKDAVVGKLTWDARGQATIRLLPGVAHEKNVDAVLQAVASALG